MITFGHRPLFVLGPWYHISSTGMAHSSQETPLPPAHICKGRYDRLLLQMLGEKSRVTCGPLQADELSLLIGCIYSGPPCNLQPR